MDLGLIAGSIEGLVRFDTNKGSVQTVKITERALAEVLVNLSDHRCAREFMTLALQTVAQALFGLDPVYRLEIKRLSRGRRPPQLSEVLATKRRNRAVLASVAEAKQNKKRSPSKVAATKHGCSPETVKRIKRANKQNMAEQLAGSENCEVINSPNY
jgi:hypothetical protein